MPFQPPLHFDALPNPSLLRDALSLSRLISPLDSVSVSMSFSPSLLPQGELVCLATLPVLSRLYTVELVYNTLDEWPS